MKLTNVAGVMFLSTALLVSNAWGLGRDQVEGGVLPRSSVDWWQDQGMGGWRTNDGSGNPIQRDQGFTVYDLAAVYYYEGFNRCRSICGEIPQCQGVEYRTVGTVFAPANMTENGITYRYNKCEIHFDSFFQCDRSAASDSDPLSRRLDGCWTRLNGVGSGYGDTRPFGYLAY